MGLSAAFLRRHPVNELPKFDAIWKDNPNDIGYPVTVTHHCVDSKCSCLVHSVLRRF